MIERLRGGQTVGRVRARLTCAGLALILAGCVSPGPRPAFASQDQDYSSKALFHQSHGDFQAKADRYRPDIWGSALYQTESRLQNEKGSFEFFQLDGAASYPWYVDPDILLRAGGEFQMRVYDFNDSPVGASDEELYKIGARLNGAFFPDPNWRIEVDFRPGIYSDLDGTLKSEDYRFFVRGIATHRYQENLFLKFGFETSEVYRDVNGYPMAGLAWLFHPQWRIDVMLPRRAEISWAPDPNHANNFYFAVDIDGEEFHRRTKTGTGKVEVDAQVQEVRLELGGMHRMSDRVSVFGSFGVTVAGDYSWRDGAGGKYDGTIEPEFFATFGIGIDI